MFRCVLDGEFSYSFLTAYDYNRAQMRGLDCGTLQHCPAKILFDNSETSRAVVQNRSLLIKTKRHVDGDSNCPVGADRDKRRDELRRIIEQKCHAIAALDFQHTQHPTNRERLITQLGVTNPPLLIENGGAIEGDFFENSFEEVHRYRSFPG